MVVILQTLNRGSNFCVNKVQYCRAQPWTLRNDDGHDVTKKKVRIALLLYIVNFTCLRCYYSSLRQADN